MYAIEKNILPPLREWKYPLRFMEVGDSFFVESTDHLEEVRRVAAYYGRKNGRDFVVRQVSGGFRCWRINKIEIKTIYKVEKGLPIPPEYKPTPYPFREMETGDSFLFQGDIGELALLRSSAGYYGRVLNRKYSVRRVSDGYRCWRVA